MSDNKPHKPQGHEKYRCAVALLECACNLPRPVRTVRAVLKRFQQDYAGRGEKCPVAEITLRRWMEDGIEASGVPEAGRPFLEIAAEVDEGSEILRRLGAGDGLSSALRSRVLDDLIEFTREMVKTDEFKAHMKTKPSDMTALMGKLVEAEKARQGGGDLDGMLDKLDQDGAEKAIERLLGRFPALVAEIKKGLAG
jgi:hypothetical protein